eukprot:Partr_v1_DN25207_c0_g1_i2_m16642 putative Cell division control protein
MFPPANPWKYASTTVKKELKAGELGIENLANQTVKLAQKNRHIFNLMLVGESGLGKSTFVNTLFSSDLLEKKARKLTGKTTDIVPHTFELVEKDVPLCLTVIDTPGFGDQLNREIGIQPIVDYIDAQFNKFYNHENAPGFRKDELDSRVHCVLYFVNPSCHRLKELDVTVLKTLSTRANVIPVIAKADTMTPEERIDLKARIVSDLLKYDVKLYPGGIAEDRDEVMEFEPLIPFSIIGADYQVENAGKKVRGRKYRWGVAEVENESHCDFVHLRNMLLATNLRDIIDTCNSVHYFNYRMNKLRALGRPMSILQSDDQFENQIDSVKKQFAEEMARKEAVMREALFQKIKEKEATMRQAEEALARKERDLMAELEQERRTLEAEEREVEQSIQRANAAKAGKKR